MNHIEILQYLIDTYKLKDYLEIGVSSGKNYNNVKCENKESCDIIDFDSHFNIKYDITYLMPSDEMFTKLPINKKYDIIFIDGMHDEEYVDKDIINSLKHLNKGGFVCVHDVLPRCAEMQTSYECFYKETGTKKDSFWVGDVWKSITKLQDNNLEFYTVVNEDFGLTIIKYKDNPYHLDIPDYKSDLRYDYIFKETNDFSDVLTAQGKFVMHAITIEEFLNIFK